MDAQRLAGVVGLGFASLVVILVGRGCAGGGADSAVSSTTSLFTFVTTSTLVGATTKDDIPVRVATTDVPVASTTTTPRPSSTTVDETPRPPEDCVIDIGSSPALDVVLHIAPSCRLKVSGSITALSGGHPLAVDLPAGVTAYVRRPSAPKTLIQLPGPIYQACTLDASGSEVAPLNHDLESSGVVRLVFNGSTALEATTPWTVRLYGRCGEDDHGVNGASESIELRPTHGPTSGS
jgi:hypothetical protein